eukprot:scaffold2428_cov412-Prasinococcus_capsulatus_cf.AAC.15
MEFSKSHMFKRRDGSVYILLGAFLYQLRNRSLHLEAQHAAIAQLGERQKVQTPPRGAWRN